MMNKNAQNEIGERLANIFPPAPGAGPSLSVGNMAPPQQRTCIVNQLIILDDKLSGLMNRIAGLESAFGGVLRPGQPLHEIMEQPPMTRDDRDCGSPMYHRIGDINLRIDLALMAVEQLIERADFS